ncbi:TolB family protein [Longimicrobium sp.]|uniref:TolB family protein n=1 Tax=Longimicrobium sp. TaxID=2029185 RepID=UPI003B3BD87A
MPDRRSPMRVRLVQLLPMLAIFLLAPGKLFAQSVTAEAGNLFYRPSASAAPRQLTTTGLDSEPVLSPDGRTIAFIRGTPGDSVDTVLGREEGTSLWIVGVDGSGARMLVRGRSSETPSEALAMLQSPAFSPDGQRIYFLSAGWATSGAVHVVDVATGAEQFLAPGNSLEVIPSGDYAGFLLVSQHRNFLAGGSYDWYWLVSPEGREIDPVGEDEAALEEFRAMYVEP